MNISVRANNVRLDDHSMWVDLDDGRTLGVPLAWFPRLLHGSPEQRKQVSISPSGLHWEELDEDVSITGLLAGYGDVSRSRLTPVNPRDQQAPSVQEADKVRRAADYAGKIVEEQLVVVKREVERSGARVRSYIVETPVYEQVTLRDDTVTTERAVVDRSGAAGDAFFGDRITELKETAEEVIIGEHAIVREELTITKHVGQRTAKAQETLRHAELDLERSDTESAPDTKK